MGSELSRTLRGRHLTMISIGGIVGAGLFVGSSTSILTGGPATFIGFAITGLLILLVMRMLAEMADAYGYLRKRWHAGELSMPEDADVDTYFGRAKKLKEA